ncbi:MAG TPA: glycoside hydrolase family 3 C-terminal domain-containing protein [Jiangellales bacterium]|nr:glycoside hydrolase family 3 C-terminal domain-containing protein [Jiangellales bacterium]
MTAQHTEGLDVDAALAAMTLEEKASLCLGSDFWHTAAVERVDVPSVMVADGPHGLRKQPEGGDHVGLGGSVPATCFPTAAALGSSWDVRLVRRVGEALGREALAERVAVLLGPGINIKRSPLCGRNFEYFSEDPLISGALGAAMVEGVQSQGVGTSLKHYAANNQETDRLRVSADVDERPLREIYLTGFEHVVTRAQPWTVMCAYNRVNGTYASQHRWLLTEVLRDEWGFRGLVVSDWGAVSDRVAALAAGLDLEMPPNLGVSDAALVAAVRAGELDEAVLDTSVRRVLELVARAQPALADPGQVDAEAHHDLARQAARESAVLLMNEGGALPLSLAHGRTLAVVGEMARTPRYQGAGSSQVVPTRLDATLDQLEALVPEGVTVRFAAGYAPGSAGPDEALVAEAVEAVRGADAVVVFLGLPAEEESEGFDRTHMDLPTDQTALLAAVAEGASAPVVVVLSNGSAVRVSDWEQHADAVLECWLPGQAGGGAIAELLLGVASPSGKLAETLPLRLEDNPSYPSFPGDSGHVRYGEGVFVGYRGYDARDQAVSYPFGHGLSYTTFGYNDLELEVVGSVEAGDLRVAVRCRVTNTGDRSGAEVVQVYVRDPECSVARPVRELKGFVKVRLEPGESAPVEVELDQRAFAYWSTIFHDWLVEAGDFEIAVGASSRDLRLTGTLDIAAPSRLAPISATSTLEEWLADPAAAAALASLFADEAGQVGGFLAEGDLVRVIGNFPLDRLAAFPGFGIDRATLDLLAARLGQH